jgi:hypothetical protein
MYRISNEADITKMMNDNKMFLRDSVPPEIVAQADQLEVWATSFKDAGPDYCEFRFMKKNEIIFKVRVDGF